MSTTDLAASYEDIKRHGRTLLDLEQWLLKHPEVFAGRCDTLPTTALAMEVRVRSTSLFSVAEETDALPVQVDVTFTMAAPVHSLLGELVEDTKRGVRTFPITVDYPLQLPLKDWPLATALLSSYFIAEGYLYDTEPFIQRLGTKLNGHIAHHFPGMSLEKLASFMAADLIVTEDDDDEDGDPMSPVAVAVAKLLFAPRDSALTAQLPQELSL